MSSPRGSRKPPHNCGHNLEDSIRQNSSLSDGSAADGDLWVCSCGKVYAHLCDEAEGCSWQETEDHR